MWGGEHCGEWMGTGDFYATHYTRTALASSVQLLLSDVVANSTLAYDLTEVFANKAMGVVKSSDTLKLRINPMGVFFGKLTAR